jgi:hypothetical protein
MAVLLFWGRGLFVGGLAGLAAAVLPSLVLLLLPALAQGSVLGILSVLLLLSVGPLAALSLSAGAILLVLAWLRRPRSGS